MATCRYLWRDDRSPEMCANLDVQEKYGFPSYCNFYENPEQCPNHRLTITSKLLKIIQSTFKSKT